MEACKCVVSTVWRADENLKTAMFRIIGPFKRQTESNSKVVAK